jgi:hypothetical protein
MPYFPQMSIVSVFHHLSAVLVYPMPLPWPIATAADDEGKYDPKGMK